MPANYVLLNRYTLTSTAASVTFSNIPQTGYTDLKIVISGRSTRANSDPGSDLGITFNGSASGYSSIYLNGSGSGTSSAAPASATYISGALVNSSFATASTFGSTEIYIPNYTSSNSKTVSIDSTTETKATESFSRLMGALWANSASITSVRFDESNGASFVTGSTFSLYGIAALGTTPAVLPKATGGDIVVNDGTYWYHAFLSSGIFTPSFNLSCDALVVAGGGGGGAGTNGSNGGGGGGAGGLLAFTSQSLTATAYSITVGAGGTGNGSTGISTNGSDSQFATSTLVKGGGAGGSNYGTSASWPGSTGGSGGGGYGRNAAGGSATSGQGFAGGTGGADSGNYAGAGGGGATAVGANGNSAGNAGAGGAGSNTYSTWASATSTGVSGYYAGGGAGGSYSSTAATGGSGGGGNGGASNAVATTGTANTGGGGGASGGNSTGAGLGKNGGSGIVIVRYTMA